MKYRARVRLLPELGTPEEMLGQTVVVIDVLRATTTICAAVAEGVAQIIPAPGIDEARGWKSRLPDALLGGERGGVIIDGFDLGNSPREYTAEAIAGRHVVLCTTNGTVAMEHCRGADAIYVGAFANLSRIIDAVQDAPRVTLVCAGTDRCVSSEDSLFAGAVLQGMMTHGLLVEEMDDSAQLAWSQWQRLRGNAISSKGGSELMKLSDAIYDEISRSRGGRKLADIGYHEDIRFCSRVDRYEVLPALQTDAWRIVDTTPARASRASD